jgi:hypothetical protein
MPINIIAAMTNGNRLSIAADTGSLPDIKLCSGGSIKVGYIWE